MQYYAYLCAAATVSSLTVGSTITGHRASFKKQPVKDTKPTANNSSGSNVTKPFGRCAGPKPVVHSITTTSQQQQQFRDKGFLLFQSILPPATVSLLNARLELVLAGEYDRGTPPDKTPNKPALGKLKNKSKRTLQVVNVSHADSTFADVVNSAELAELVAEIGGPAFAKGARVANDQVWAKPPGAGGLVFHRDSAYFEEMLPRRVLTVWLALDDMRDATLGPLEYVTGSHKWGDLRRGSASVFFATAGTERAIVDDAARAEGLEPAALSVEKASVPAGGCGIHDGRTWHGSGPNRSDKQPRRGLGIHFIPAHSIFDPRIKANRRGKLFKHAESGDQADGDATVALPDRLALPHWSSATEACAYKARCEAVDNAMLAGGHNLVVILLLQPAVCVGLDRAASGVLAASCRAAQAATLMWDEPDAIKQGALETDRRAGAIAQKVTKRNW